jgi:hypothetical protein
MLAITIPPIYLPVPGEKGLCVVLLEALIVLLTCSINTEASWNHQDASAAGNAVTVWFCITPP